ISALERLKDKEYLSMKEADIYAEIGYGFNELESWTSSIEHCLTALDWYRNMEISNSDNICRLHTTLGSCYGRTEMYNSAIEHFKNALKINEDNNSCSTVKESIFLNHQLGYCYYMSEQYEMAFEYCEKSIYTVERSLFHRKYYTMTDSYEIIANIYVYYEEKTLACNCYIRVLELLSADDESVSIIKISRIQNSLKSLNSKFWLHKGD
ncbi:unnamed protein product, partial [Didymodactylos carnosus]